LAKRALTKGITGQYGNFLAEFPLERVYGVHGVIRRASTFDIARVVRLRVARVRNSRLFPHHGDLTDSLRITALLHQIHPAQA
jgi:GDPmannose 4,6-dehydratase